MEILKPVVFGLLLLVGSGAAPAAADLSCFADSNAPVIDLRTETLRGEPMQHKQHRGAPVLIDVWATWCGACQETLTAVNALAASPATTDLAVVGLSIDRNPADAIAWLTQALPERKLLDWRANPSPTFSALDIRALPATLLLDAHGAVLARHEGTESNTLAALLDLARHCGQSAD